MVNLFNAFICGGCVVSSIWYYIVVIQDGSGPRWPFWFCVFAAVLNGFCAFL